MPDYDYKCTDEKCNNEMVEFRLITDESAPPVCNKCGKPTYRHIKFEGSFKGLSTPGASMSNGSLKHRYPKKV